MKKEDKYYYVKHTNSSSVTWRPSTLIKSSFDFEVEIDEDVDHRQNFSLSVDKMPKNGFAKPLGGKYTKVLPIIKEVFIEHYSLAVKYLHESQMDDGEFYLQNRSKDWIMVEYYSRDEKKKHCISIDFRDQVDNLWLMVRSESGHKGRQFSRKDGKAITPEEFQKFLNLTVQFLYDPNSYNVLMNDYIKNMKALAGGSEEPLILTFGSEKAFTEIIEQLNLRAKAIEKQLIEDDSQIALDRAQLRGELKGLQYAVSTIKKFT